MVINGEPDCFRVLDLCMDIYDETSGRSVKEQAKPETGKSYWVGCKDYKCRAVVDKTGKWKSFYTRKELLGVITFAAIL